MQDRNVYWVNNLGFKTLYMLSAYIAFGRVTGFSAEFSIFF